MGSDLVVDGYDEEPLMLLDVAEFAKGLKNSMERTRRIFSSGLADINRWEEINGKRIMSMLASDGKYVACIPPNGKTYYGATREDAVKARVAGEKLRR